MDNAGKAHDTPYGSSVISNQPLVTPAQFAAHGLKSIADMVFSQPATPHAGPQPHAGTQYHLNGEPTPPTETLGSIVGDFLERIVSHVTKRVSDDVAQQLREMEDRLAMAMVTLHSEEDISEDIQQQYATGQTYEELCRTIAEQRLAKLADELDDVGVQNNYVVGDQGELAMLLVHDAHHRMWTIRCVCLEPATFVCRMGSFVAPMDEGEGEHKPMFGEAVVTMFRAMREGPLPHVQV